MRTRAARERAWIVLVLSVGLFSTACASQPVAPTPVACSPLPDAQQALAQAWQAYQPDQSISPAITLRRRLFALQALLISAGMYGDPPAPPEQVYADYAPQFVRDFGRGRDEGLASALKQLAQTLEQDRDRSDAELGANCGLILARQALRADPAAVSTDWTLQTVTWGFAPYFQTSIRQLILEDATACAAQPDTTGVSERILSCTLAKVGV
jgi:hypothetical protein